jgi:hypothetical protein
MAVAIVSTYAGPKAKLEKYDDAVKLLGGTPEGKHPAAACLFHWVEDTPEGFQITNVFKTRADWDEFAAQKLAPVIAQVDLPDPRKKFIEVARFMTAG